ncbi:MAG: hypothetical protein ACLFRP_00235 [Puniceicoccaceae bacterium]
MSLANPKLNWCVVRLGNDMNWWVKEISDDIHWDVDGLGIIDPRQIGHIIDLLEPLQEYHLDPQIFENAFFGFEIDREIEEGVVRLVRTKGSFLETDEPVFALPDVIDDEKGPYADFIDHITRLRVRMLNDLIDFSKKLTVDELEEEIREQQNSDLLEGRATHFFHEITSILEYVPEGYELEADDDIAPASEEDAVEEDFVEIETTDESIEEDDTMRWEDEEDSEGGGAADDPDEHDRPEKDS